MCASGQWKVKFDQKPKKGLFTKLGGDMVKVPLLYHNKYMLAVGHSIELKAQVTNSQHPSLTQIFTYTQQRFCNCGAGKNKTYFSHLKKKTNLKNQYQFKCVCYIYIFSALTCCETGFSNGKILLHKPNVTLLLNQTSHVCKFTLQNPLQELLAHCCFW